MIHSPLVLLTGLAFSTWLSFIKVPSKEIFLCLVLAVFGDLITGLQKSWATGIATKSTGFRRSILKIGVYITTILGVMILVSMIGLIDKSNAVNLKYLIDALVGAMVFIELYSMFENISEAYPKSLLTRYLINPILKMLRGKLESTKDQINNDNGNINTGA